MEFRLHTYCITKCITSRTPLALSLKNRCDIDCLWTMFGLERVKTGLLDGYHICNLGLPTSYSVMTPSVMVCLELLLMLITIMATSRPGLGMGKIKAGLLCSIKTALVLNDDFDAVHTTLEWAGQLYTCPDISEVVPHGHIYRCSISLP